MWHTEVSWTDSTCRAGIFIYLQQTSVAPDVKAIGEHALRDREATQTCPSLKAIRSLCAEVRSILLISRFQLLNNTAALLLVLLRARNGVWPKLLVNALDNPN